MKTYKPAVSGSRVILEFLLAAAAVALAACAGPAGTVPPMISVQVAPPTANVATSQTQQFTATVSGTTNTAVTWQVSSTSASAASIGTISASGLYTAPANVPTGGTITVTAISQADTTKTGTAVATVTAPAIAVTVSPKTPSVRVGLTQQFTATVTNTANTAVTWQVNNVTGGGTTTGTISTAGLYTAPAAVPSGSVTVKAISVADVTKSDTATITITVAPAVSVTVSPKTPSVQVASTQQFTANVLNTANTAVTWQVNNVTGGGTTTGTISTAGLYTAPAAVPSGSVTVKAISVADATKSDTATVTITVAPAVSVTVSPKTPSVQVALTQQFTANVLNTTNTAVTWQVNAVTGGSTTTGTISASGLFTAPATVPASNPVTVKAISAADNTKSDTATVTITPAPSVTVTIAPKRGGLTPGQTITFTPTVTGSTNTSVTWEVDGVAGGSSTVGLITAGGVYTAPNSGGVHNIVARSVANITVASVASAIGVTDLAGVFTYHNDISRSGANTHEFALTTSNVTTTSFGKLFSCTVDAAIYAQPLWVANLLVSGVNHNVVYLATQHNSVYAFDADSSSCTNVWGGAKNLNGTGETWVTSADQSGCADLVPDIGIVGTPVIDPSTSTIYVVARSKIGATFHQRLHALDLATGAEKFSGPVDIQATISGTGNGSSGGKLNFDTKVHNQRPALLLTGNHIIITWASHCDFGTYHGWVMSYNSGTLAQEAAFSVSPNGSLNGIWMSGSGPAADAGGNIYFSTGNGSFDANTGGADYSNSILELGPPSGGTFPIATFFAPSDQSTLNGADRDLGSGGVMLLPNVSSNPNHLLVQAGKDGRIFLCDRSSLGGFSATTNNVVQEVDGQLSGGMWASPAFWNNNVYFGSNSDNVKAFSFNQAGTGKLSTTWTSRTPTGYGFPGTTPSVSAHPSLSGTAIVWALNTANNGTEGTTSGPAVLHAYDATNLATELWNSSAVSADAAGNAVKFTVPTVANGKVYVGEQGTLTVYSLKP